VEQGLPLGSPGVWTVTVRFGATPIGSKTVLLTDGTTGTTGTIGTIGGDTTLPLGTTAP
jgi:hypothetical protein